ncbi:hypothetical protein B7463_g870, partial [Scytalidium lignicola]
MTIEEMYQTYPRREVEAAMFQRNYKIERQKWIENYQKQINDGINARQSMEDYINIDPTEPQDLDEDVKWRMRIIKAANPQDIPEAEMVNRNAVLEAYRQKKLKVDGQITIWFAGKMMMGPLPRLRQHDLLTLVNNLRVKWNREYGLGRVWVEEYKKYRSALSGPFCCHIYICLSAMHLWKHNFRGKYLVGAITAASCQAFLLLGYDQGVMAGIIGADNKFGRDFNHPSPDLQGDITGLYDIGCVVGSIACYFIGDRFGRRSMLICGGAIMIIGSIILATSHSVAQLIVGRIVTGFGNGMNSSTAPVYLSECSPPRIRGALLTLQGTVTILGVVIAYWLDYGTSYSDAGFQWRFPLGFQAIFAVFLILQVIGLPETPRWLVENDQYEEGRAVTAALLDKPLDDEEVTGILADIRSLLEEESRGGPFRFRELFTMGKTQNFRRLLITISVQLGQQFTGSNMINYYAPVIFQEAMGLSRNLSLILGGCAQCTYLVGSAIPVFLMDRFGRRVLLMACSGGLCLCFVTVTILLSLGTVGPAYGATVFIFIFQLIYGIGWLPVPWFYPSEINTTRVRGRMQAIASGWNWMAVFAVVKITPISFANIGWRTFIIFAVLNAVFIPMIYCFYPETKGLKLEDIDELFPKQSLTGGVFTSGGRTLLPPLEAEDTELAKAEAKKRVTTEQYIEDTTNSPAPAS